MKLNLNNILIVVAVLAVVYYLYTKYSAHKAAGGDLSTLF
jgi:hypothetical protein